MVHHGEIKLERQQALKLLGWGIRFFLTAALSASRTPGGYAPFALGCVAASGSGGGGMAALAGALVGAALFLEFEDALPFLAVAVLLEATAMALRGTAFDLEKHRFAPLVAGGWFLAVEGIYVLQSLSPAEHAAPCLAGAILTGVAAWFYRPLLGGGGQALSPGNLLFLVSSMLLAAGDLELFGLSLGRCLLSLVLLFAAFEGGSGVGASVGLGMGLMVDLCTESGSVLFSAAYGIAGWVAGSRSRRRSRAALAFLTANLVTMLPVREPLGQSLILEAAVGAGLFLLLPPRLFGGKRILRADREGEAESSVLDRLRRQLTATAEALRDLYDSMAHSTPLMNEENPAVVFDRAAEKVCRGCALCELCWQRCYTDTFNAMNDATPSLLERGRALPKDFPGYFTDRCIHLSEFLGAINGELTAFLLRRQYRKQLDETRSSARGQYAQLSELLSATAAGLGKAVAVSGEEREPCRIGAALRPRQGESVCGDTVVSFRTEEGRYCLLLADGMGSGEPARKESALACRLMRQFLEAGIEPEAALRTMNAAMALRGADTGSFTTMDLLTCEEGTGQAAFYKFGAAPSYLKKGGVVRRITGGTLPVGLRGTAASPDITRLTLEEGSFAVLISDGVADPSEDEWLMNLLAGWEGEDPQRLAGAILAESIRQEKLADDCGIQVLYLPAGSRKKV